MTDDSNFNALLESEIRWPQRGDQLFQKAENWWDSTWFPEHRDQRLAMMIVGFKKSGDLTVERAMAVRPERDFLVYPAIFSYRHMTELWLKSLIADYGPSVGITPDWKSHDLADLWGLFFKILKRYEADDVSEETQTVAALVAEFAKADPGSFSYRYPTDRKGNVIPLGHDQLDLGALANAVQGMNTYFTGCDGYLDHQKTLMREYSNWQGDHDST